MVFTAQRKATISVARALWRSKVMPPESITAVDATGPPPVLDRFARVAARGRGGFFRSHAEARMAIFRYIEGWYNPRRRHSALDYQSPIDYEKKHLEAA
jgi:transposase InsO family protein